MVSHEGFQLVAGIGKRRTVGDRIHNRPACVLRRYWYGPSARHTKVYIRGGLPEHAFTSAAERNQQDHFVLGKVMRVKPGREEQGSAPSRRPIASGRVAAHNPRRMNST